MTDTPDPSIPPAPGPEQRIADLESELRRYRQLFETLPVPVWYHDGRGRALSNAAMQRMLHLPANQLENLSSSDAQSLLAGSFHSQANGSALPQLIHTAEDGTLSYFTLHTNEVATEAGRALLIYLEDAGVEQSLTDALAARESQLSAIVANIPGMAYQFEAGADSSSWTYVSEGSRLIYGLEPEAVMDRPDLIFERVFADDREEFLRISQAATAEFKPWAWEGRVEREDGSVIWVHCSSHPTALPGGIRWDGFIIDITERKQAELAAEESQRRLNGFMDAMPVGVYVIDGRGAPIYVNDRAREMLGRGAAPSVAREMGALAEMYQIRREGTGALYPAAELPIARALRGEAVTVDDVEIERAPGDVISLEASAQPIIDGSGRVLYAIATFRDITHYKQRAREYAALQEEIIRMQANALAELSTPLIQLDQHTMLMPLIGAVDSQRAQHIIEALLHGVAESRARVALVDLTGVPVVDTQVASAIIRAAQSVRLLGAEVVLTGIRPEIAQTLVSLGVDLSTMSTRSNLQMGISYALERNTRSLRQR